jgi:hypothetical protein
MRKFLMLGASAVLFASLVVDEASAQRGHGVRGGPAFRGAAISPGFRGARVGPAYVGRAGWGGPGYVGRRVAWGGYGPYRRYGYGPYRYGWGWPVAAGLTIAAAGYYGSCLRWNGWDWVNVCYEPNYAYYPYEPDYGYSQY